MLEINSIDFKKIIPSYIFLIAKKLEESNYQAYLVGGSIRDILMGVKPNDFDIGTNAYPEEIINIFPKSIPTGAKFGTVTIIVKDEKGENFDVQVTTYRSEADYISGRWPSHVEFARTIQEDLSRRDFNINAIALNLNINNSKNYELIDPYNGILDLQNKLIKAVRDPLERFTEDGLRAVRGCRFASQLNFEIEKNTLEAMKQTINITKLISVERFKEELMKLLLKSSKPSIGLRLMKEVGILNLFIPELLEGIGIVQPEFHSDDVFEHSILTVDEAEDSVKLAALFHDIGKPRTRKIEKLENGEEKIHFYGHDLVGAEMTQNIMKRLKFSNAEIDRTVKLVRWHMFYYPSANWRNDTDVNLNDTKNVHGWTDGAIRRLVNNVGGEQAIDDLLKLRIADQMSNKKYEFNQKELDFFSQRISKMRSEEMILKLTDLDISGEDLIKELNLTQGKILGNILQFLLEKVIDDPLLNKKELLITEAKNYLNSKNL